MKIGDKLRAVLQNEQVKKNKRKLDAMAFLTKRDPQRYRLEAQGRSDGSVHVTLWELCSDDRDTLAASLHLKPLKCYEVTER